MKKLVTIILALAMLLSLGITAFADDTATTLTVTPHADGIERTYVGHQLLKLISVSEKPADQHECDGTNHLETCYNYAYEVIAQYRTILQEEVAQYAGTGFWGNIVQPETSKIADEDLVRYLSTLTSDVDGGYGTLRKVADRIYREIKKNNLNPEAAEFTTTTSVEKGYWIFADVTDVAGDNEANSLVIVDTLAQDNITIKPKTDLPTLTKKVQDIEDSEHPSIDNNEWHDSADHDVGDKVPFKLTATLPSNVQYYTSYTLTFHDTLSAALALAPTNRLNNQDFYKVYMYTDLGLANADFDLNAGEDVTAYFSAVENKADADCTFELTGDIYKLPNAHNVITNSTVFVVYYEAELLNNEALVLGNPGNPNTAYLEYSNDPYSESTGKTEEDTVVVFTHAITVNKVDQNNNALAGAGFTLYKKYQDGSEVVVGGEQGGKDSTLTTFTWEGLDDGDYILKETTVPDGFNGMADRSFTITATHDMNSDEPKLTYLGTTSYTGDADTGVTTFSVVNRTGAALPETGAEGTFFLITCCALLVVVAVVFMITRKKMSVYED